MLPFSCAASSLRFCFFFSHRRRRRLKLSVSIRPRLQSSCRLLRGSWVTDVRGGATAGLNSARATPASCRRQISRRRRPSDCWKWDDGVGSSEGVDSDLQREVSSLAFSISFLFKKKKETFYSAGLKDQLLICFSFRQRCVKRWLTFFWSGA